MAPRQQGDEGEQLLFNIERDPYEENDVSNAFPDVVRTLEQLLDRLETCGSRYLEA